MTISEHITDKEQRPNPPRTAYDSEYATQFRREVDYLKDRGIDYVYKKRIGEYRIPTYKYKKTPELFRAVADFYEQRRLEKTFEAFDAVLEAAAAVEVLTRPQT